jgi:tetratricopeptide (TPR) repeat protein
LPSDNVRELTAHLETAGLAQERHDTTAAIRELTLANDLTRPSNSSADILFELGSAYLDTHDDSQASARFERIINSGAQRAGDPISFVRSLYFLGQISERKGDRAKAAEYYRRFVQYWGDGDMDRDRVADAKKKAG